MSCGYHFRSGNWSGSCRHCGHPYQRAGGGPHRNGACGQVAAGPPHHASCAAQPADNTELDRAIILWLPGPGTYTGEDLAELHLHGGPAVIHDVADALVAARRPAGGTW